MITAQNVTDLVNAITALITADANDKTALAAAQATIQQLQSNDAALSDPSLQASVDAALQATAAATTPPAPSPEPVPLSGTSAASGSAGN